VGLKRDQPHRQVDAFAATLQEAADADLLLHVVDASNPSHPEQIASVLGVLKDIGADQVPQILLFNKLDAMDPASVPLVLSDAMELEGVSVPRIFVSARTGAGLPELRALLAARVLEQKTGPGPMTPGPFPEIDEPVS
jgi:GTP-binding protein HflX